jgi:tetratricopeptide (TPR) repeat protein
MAEKAAEKRTSNSLQSWNALSMLSIQDDPENAATIERLVGHCGPAGCTPFVGAGLSVPWGFPSWWSFLVQAASSCGIREHISAMLEGDDYDRYERAAEIVHDTLIACGERHGLTLLVRRTFGRKICVSARPQAAAHVLPAIARGGVVTTNYDRVIEGVFSQQGRPLFPVWGGRVRIVQDSLSAEAPILLKLHGDAWHAQDRILTGSEYDEHYGRDTLQRFLPDKPVPRLLQAIFKSKPVLFFGCSLADDRTMDVLGSIADAARTQCFAVIAREADARRQRAKEARIARFGISPIWYPTGAHDAIRPFLEHLATRLPPVPVSLVALGRGGAANDVLAAERQAAWERFTQEKVRAVGAAHELEQISDPDRQWEEYLEKRDLLRLAPVKVRLRLYRALSEKSLSQHPDRALSVQVALYFALREEGQEQAANRMLADAGTTAARLPPSEMTIDFHHTLATHYSHVHDWGSANRHSQLALRQARAICFEHPFAYRRMWYRRGSILLELGKRRAARRYLAAALCDARRAGDAEDIAHYLAGLAGWYFDDDHPHRAARLARIGIAYAPMTAYSDRATLFGNLGSALCELGSIQEGTDAHRQAWWYQLQGTRDEIGTLIHVANVAWSEYRVFEKSGGAGITEGLTDEHLEWSLDLFDQALRMAEANGLAESRAHLLVQRALPLARLGQTSKALADIRRAVRYLWRTEDSFLATAYNNRALIWHWRGKRAIARCWYERALSFVGHEVASGLRNTIIWSLNNLRDLDSD